MREPISFRSFLISIGSNVKLSENIMTNEFMEWKISQALRWRVSKRWDIRKQYRYHIGPTCFSALYGHIPKRILKIVVIGLTCGGFIASHRWNFHSVN